MKVEEIPLLIVALAFCIEMIKGLTIRNNDNETEFDMVYELYPLGRSSPMKEIHSLDYGVKKVPRLQLTATSKPGNKLLEDFGKKHINDNSMDGDFRKLYEPEPDLSEPDSSLEARRKDYDWYDDEDLKKLMSMIDELIEPAENITSKVEVKERSNDKFKDKNNGSKETNSKKSTENPESHYQQEMQERLNTIPEMDDSKERLKAKVTNESINDMDKLINETTLINRILESEKNYSVSNKFNDSSKDKNNGRTTNIHKMDELVSRNLPNTDYDSEFMNFHIKPKKKSSENLMNGERLIGRNKPKLKTLPENEKLLDDLVSLFEMQRHMNDSNGRSIYVFENRQKDNNEPGLSARNLTDDQDKQIVGHNPVNNNVLRDHPMNSELMVRNLPEVKLIQIDATDLLAENKAFNKLKKIIKGNKKSVKKHKRKNNLNIEQRNITKEILEGQEPRSLTPQIQPVTLYNNNNNSNTNNITLNKDSQSAVEIDNNLTQPNLTESTTDDIKSRSRPISTIEREIYKNTTNQNNDEARNFTKNFLTSNKFENDSISVMPVSRSFESYSNHTDDYKNYDDEKLNREVEEIMKLLADDEIAEKENNELMERSASEINVHDLFPESYEMKSRSQIDPESYEEIRLQMMKQLLSMEGPKECKRTRNLNNVVYPDAKSISHQVSYYDTERNLKEIEEHETYLCIDPPKYPDYFFKLQTVIKVVPKTGEGPEVIKAIERKYYDYNGREFNWEPETPNSSSS